METIALDGTSSLALGPAPTLQALPPPSGSSRMDRINALLKGGNP